MEGGRGDEDEEEKREQEKRKGRSRGRKREEKILEKVKKIILYCRSDFNCKILLIVNCEFFHNSK